jgi:hypothetical protein
MRLRERIVAALFWMVCLQGLGRPQSALPREEALRPGVVASVPVTPGPSVSSDNMAIPEGGVLADGSYRNDYFGFSYRLPRGWEQVFEGPPPSDTGHYVLAEFSQMDERTGLSQGSILITASDEFFAPREGDSPKHLIDALKAKLAPVYQLEDPPTEVRLASRSFVRLNYQAPAAELHWRILAAQMRCHIVEFIFASRDVKLLDALVQRMDGMQMAAMSASGLNDKGEDEVPICIQNYATGPNLVHKVDPGFAGPKFTSIPTRILIDKNGKVKQVHVISAFPAQADSIKTALAQWEFKPYVEDGRPREVETGLMFEFPPRARSSEIQMPGNPSRY